MTRRDGPELNEGPEPGEQKLARELAKYPGEQELAQQLAEYLKHVVIAEKTFLSGATRRDVHGKSVAALKAQLIVDLEADEVPEQLRHGVFAQSGSYPAWIRLSNGAQHPGPDYKRDVRGFVIKLMGVEGEKLLSEEPNATTQDFLFLTTQTFFCVDTAELFGLIKALNRGLLATAWFGFLNPWLVLAGFRAKKRFANLLEAQFWSTTPYKLGPDLTVKYSIKRLWFDGKGHVLDPAPTSSPPLSKIPDDPGRNYLREACERTLHDFEVSYGFYVQVRNPLTDSIDDRRVPIPRLLLRLLPPELPEPIRKILEILRIQMPWKGPLQRVATIRIPQQRVDTPERNWAAENLAMNVWHSLPAHEPVGNLNRGRLLTYLEVAKFRRERNLLPSLEEPTAPPDFLADTGPGALEVVR